jgi:signal transduction histidine kinase
MLAGFAADELPWLSTIFYLHLLAESITFFGPVEVALVVTACSLFCLLVPGVRSLPLARITIVCGAITFACSYGKRKLDRSIARLEAQLAEAQKGQEKALEDERKRIADDFHDGPLQSFINLQIRLDVLRKVLERDFARGLEDLRQLESLAQSQVRDLRAFLNGMRPVEIDGANLMASARRTAENFQKESGIPVTFVGANTPVGLPHEASSEVLQMLREALHNVRKHAGATRVAVAMDKTDRGLEVSVDDNGNGFAFSGTYTLEELELLRLGPASLKRRARALNADLLLESRPGRGAGLKFRIPL